MSEKGLGPEDQKRLQGALHRRFPRNDEADRLLAMIGFPPNERPNFDADPVAAWGELLREHPAYVPTLLSVVPGLFSAEVELAQIAESYFGTEGVPKHSPKTVAVLGARDDELAGITDAFAGGRIGLVVHTDPAELITSEADVLHIATPLDGPALTELARRLCAERTRRRALLSGVVLNFDGSQAAAASFRPAADVVVACAGRTEPGCRERFATILYDVLPPLFTVHAAALGAQAGIAASGYPTVTRVLRVLHPNDPLVLGAVRLQGREFPDLLRVFGKRWSNATEAQLVLRHVTYPVDEIPPFRDVASDWYRVFEKVEHGIIAGGFGELIQHYAEYTPDRDPVVIAIAERCGIDLDRSP